MPTDAAAGDGDDLPAEFGRDELTFAAHDLGRGRSAEQPAADLGFTPAPRAEDPPSPPAADGFVIRQPHGVVPSAPVDALVVGAPEPAPMLDAPPATPANAFRISSSTAPAAQPSADQLWTTRDPAPEPAPVPASRRGWSTRRTEVVDRSAHATMLRLREEAVNVSWKAAWIAVTSANPRLLRKRDL